jgi:hypothetical protein
MKVSNRRHSSRLKPTSVGTFAAEPPATSASGDVGIVVPSTNGENAPRPRGDELRDVDVEQVARRDAEMGCDLGRECGGVRTRARDEIDRAALEDGALEQAVRGGHREQVRDGDRTRGLAHHRDIGGVAAEARDVVAHPGKRGDLIEETGVAVRELVAEQIAQVEEAGDAEPVVIERLRAGAHDERAAVDPDDDRARLRGRDRCVDVEDEAVLAHRRLVGDAAHHRSARIADLHRERAELERVAHGGGALDGDGRAKPRRAGVRDASPGRHALALLASHLTACGLDDHRTAA